MLYVGSDDSHKCVFLTEDEMSVFSDSLMSYNIAEAICQGHNVAIVCSSSSVAEGVIRSLPFKILDESESLVAGDAESNYGLQIAWQYKKYIDKGTKCAEQNFIYRLVTNVVAASKSSGQLSAMSSSKSRYCHSFDISKRYLRIIAFKSFLSWLYVCLGFKSIFCGKLIYA